MSFSLFTEISWLYSIPIVLLAGVATWFLYKGDKRLEDCPSAVYRILLIVRFLSISLLIFFLLSPFIKSIVNTIKKPVVVFVQDASESVSHISDSAVHLSSYKEELKNVLNLLGKDYHVELLTFGEKIARSKSADSIEFNQKKTSYASLFSYIEKTYSAENLGGIVVASDGIYNEGNSPLYEAEVSGISCPVYSVGLGDTVQKKDVAIQQIISNKIAFTSSNIPVRITVSAKMAEAQNPVLSIYHNGKVVASQRVFLENENFAKDIDLTFTPPEVGVQTFIARIDSIDGEWNTKNNEYYFTIEILDERKKILCLYSVAHPDLMAFKSVLQKSTGIESDFLHTTQFSGKVEDYNMVILYQLPTKERDADLLISQVQNANLPTLQILGPHISTAKLNALSWGFSIAASKSLTDEVYPHYNKYFTLFANNQGVEDLTKIAHPLVVPYGKYNLESASTIMMSQKVGATLTDKPLIFFNNEDGVKRGFIAGEGIWRWRMAEIKETGNSEIFDGTFADIVDYLALKVKRDRFNLNYENIIYETDKVVMNADVYDATFMLDNSNDVEVELSDTLGNKFEFVFSKSDNRYFSSFGVLPVGKYKFIGKVKNLNGEILHTKAGEFQVLPVEIETRKLQANYTNLRELSAKFGGEFITAKNISSLVQKLNSNKEIVPVSYETTDFSELINFKVLLAILLALFITEWIIRRFNGAI